MTINDIRFLIRIFGKSARVIDVVSTLSFVVSMGEHLKNGGEL